MARKTFNELRQLEMKSPMAGYLRTHLSKLAELGINVPQQDAPALIRTLLSVLAKFGGYQIPPPVLQVASNLLKVHSGAVICDPWGPGGLGEIYSSPAKSSSQTKPTP